MLDVRKVAVCALASAFVSVALLQAQGVAPGTINCFEGQVSLDGHPVSPDSAGKAILSQIGRAHV